MSEKRRGRPEKKPGYDRESEIQKLIATAVDLAVEPFDEDRDEDLPTLTEIADAMDTTLLRVRKLLITAGFFTSDISTTVQELSKAGMDIKDIMEATGLGKASVYSYLPYTKGAYNLESPTLYSEQGKRYRNRRAAVEDLKMHRGLPEETVFLWKAICAFENYPFTTSGRGGKPGVDFSYSISAPGGPGGRKYSGPEVPGFGNEMWVIVDGVKKEKSISRFTADLAYKNALKLMDTVGDVKGPKSLGVPGAGSYLYPVFVRIGVIHASSSYPSELPQ